jgi:hypothetical protein
VYHNFSGRPKFSFPWHFYLKAQIQNEVEECKVDLEIKFHDYEKDINWS